MKKCSLSRRNKGGKKDAERQRGVAFKREESA